MLVIGRQLRAAHFATFNGRSRANKPSEKGKRRFDTSDFRLAIAELEFFHFVNVGHSSLYLSKVKPPWRVPVRTITAVAQDVDQVDRVHDRRELRRNAPRSWCKQDWSFADMRHVTAGHTRGSYCRRRKAILRGGRKELNVRQHPSAAQNCARATAVRSRPPRYR